MDIEKPFVDQREYCFLSLENGLEVLLISDETTDKASASLDVHVGHLHDPPNISGIAHFCEHLLFMGTEEYPQENDYSQFLSAHSGFSNAYTSAENTNYFFDVSSDHFYEALRRFSAFFKSPLFSDSCTDRELLAVDSEHKKNIQQDYWRLYQLEKDLSDKNHVWHKFGTGNLNTLKVIPESNGLEIRKVLLEFYEKNYSANIMKCVLLGKERISKLKEYAIQLFSGVVNKNVQVSTWDQHPLHKEHLQVFDVWSIKDVKELVLEFPFPDLQEYYHKNPCKIMAHLIGHEGDGSILAELKKNGWALELSAGLQSGGKGFSFFKINVEMTDQGLKNYEAIIHIIFQYILMMKHQLSLGVLKWIYHECQLLGEISFKFKEQIAPARYTSRLANQMHDYHYADVLSGPYLLKEFDPDLIKDCMNYLREDNFRYLILARHTDTPGSWTKAQHYGTEYQIFGFSHELKEILSNISESDRLHLPRKNEFLPENLSVIHRADEPVVSPSIFKESPILRLWYKKDDTFFVPKAYCWIQIKSHFSYDSPLKSVYSKMYCAVVEHLLNETSYYAECAGLNFNIESTVSGIIVHVSGFNDKLHVLLEEILECMTQLKLEPDVFQIVKEKVKRELKNFEQEMPYHHAMYYWSHALQEKMWSYHEKLDVIDAATIQGMEEFNLKLFNRVFIEAFIHGNYQVEVGYAFNFKNVARLCTTLETTFSQAKQLKEVLYSRIFGIEKSKPIIYAIDIPNSDNVNCAIEFYLQTGAYEDKLERCKLFLLQQISHEPVFDNLRTKEQLGYIVFDGVRKQTGFVGYRIVIQSERDPIYLESRIEEYLAQLSTILSTLSQEKFEKQRSSLVMKLKEKHKNLNQEAGRLWSHIQSGYFEFDQNEQDSEIIARLDLKEIQEFFDIHIKKGSVERRKFSVHLRKKDQQQEPLDGNKIITMDMLAGERANWQLGPAPSPYGAVSAPVSIMLSIPSTDCIIKPQEKVAFCFVHCKELIISLFAVWAMDAIYVPLSDPSLTKIHTLGIRFMIGLYEDFRSMGATAFNLMDDIYCIKILDTCHVADQTNIAYIMHTSGTTREGLGGIRVTVPTASFLDNLDSVRDRLQNASQLSSRICPLVSETTFDPSLIEICLPLLCFGENDPGSLVLLERFTTRMPQKLFDCIKTIPINLLMMTPSLFMSLSHAQRKYICQGETEIEDIVLGGESFPESLLYINPRKIRLWNIYGTTECSVWAFMGLAESSPVSLGKPLGSTEWKIENGRMYLGGSKRVCYLNDEMEPVLLRDTGDLVRMYGDSLYFVGRSDSLIKRHGYRIHLSQISQSIKDLNIFQHYEVLYMKQGDIDEIVCFYVGKEVSDDYIREKLEQDLPWYSIPSFIRMESFPLSAHGKLDISGLKESYYASLNPSSSLSLKDIIAQRLNLKNQDLDVNGHFLAHGGSSFVAAMIIQQVSQYLGINQSPDSKKIKSDLLNSLLHDTIKIFIDFAEETRSKSHEYDKQNLSIGSNVNSWEKGRRDINRLLKVKWKINLEKCIDGSPIINNNTLFIGSHSGLFVAVNCSSGSVNWRRRFPNRIEGSPSVSPDGTIVVFGCYDHFIYTLCTKSGRVISEFETNGIVKACPMFDVEKRCIWIGSYDHFLYCIDPMTNNVLYYIDLGSSICSKCSLSPKMNSLIATTTKGSIFSLKIEGKDLKIHWKVDLRPIFSDPLLDKDSGDIFIGCTDNHLYRLSGINGTILWKLSTQGPIFSSPKFWSDDIIVVGSHSSMLFCVSKNKGKIVKTFKSDSPVFGSPCVFSDKCCFTSIEGIIHLIYREEEVAKCQLDGKVFSSPICHDSTLYVGSRDDHVYALDISQTL